MNQTDNEEEESEKVENKTSIGRRSYLKASSSVAGATVLLNSSALTARGGSRTRADEGGGSFDDPGIDTRTKVRWMIPGAYADPAELEEELELLAASGYGGAEVTLSSIPEPQSQGLGTNAWSDRVRTILEKGNDLDLEIDFHISGLNGLNLASPTISPDDPGASKVLVHGEATLSSGETYQGPVPEPVAPVGEYSQAPFLQTILPEAVEERELIAVQGARIHETNDPDASTTVLDPDSIRDVTEAVENGEITWTAPEQGGDWLLLSFWQRGSGIAIEGMGPEPFFKIDFYSQEGTQEFIDFYEEHVFSDSIRTALTENDGDFFKDSYGADDMWTPELLSEFEARRGYSLSQYLPVILQYYATFPGNGLPNTKPLFDFPGDLGDSVRNDHRQTLSDLYQENHIEQMNDWAASYGLEYRGQVGYSEIVDPQQAAAAIDVPETESLYYDGHIDGYRAQSGAVHMAEKEEYSTEVAPVGGKAYAQTWTDLVGRINRSYAGGVNRTVLHVFNYRDSPSASWPGFSSFGHGFSAALSGRSPKWEHASITAEYLARTQRILQRGTGKRDVAVYQHTYTLPEAGAGERAPVDVDPLPYWNDDGLRNTGYTYDFVGPQLLESSLASYEDGQINPAGPGYEAFVFNSDIGPDVRPSATSMPLETAERLLEFAADGLPVVIVGEAPDHVPGKPDAEESKTLQKVVNELLAQPTVRRVNAEADVPAALEELEVRPDAEPAVTAPLVSAHRSTDSAEYYYLYNKSEDESVATDVAFEGRHPADQANPRSAGRPYRLDPWSGSIEPIARYDYDDDRIVLDVELAPQETVIVAIGDDEWRDDVEAVGVHATETDGDDVVPGNGQLELRASSAGTYSTTLSNGNTVETEIGSVPDPQRLDSWDLRVESWEPTEAALDADGGVAATETKTVPIDVELDGLRPWPEIDELQDVSGVGTYETTVDLGKAWSDEHGAVLDLGDVFDTFRVWVNGEEVPTPDQVTTTIDIGDYLESGTNSIEVEVVTTLRNRLRTMVDAQAGNDRQDYGLHGPVRLLPYAQVPLPSKTDTGSSDDTGSADGGSSDDRDSLPGFGLGVGLLGAAGGALMARRGGETDDNEP